MSETFNLTMGDRGRIVVPAQIRERAGLVAGTSLVMVETPDGLVLLTREQLKARVRADLADLELVEELLAERRARAAVEDAA
jgi:AbrB family looped-hinge helix DNA binding protein